MTDVWGGIAMGVGLLWAYFPRLEKIEQFLLTPFAPLKLWLILLGIYCCILCYNCGFVIAVLFFSLCLI
jgi:hypothetical protein